MAPRDGHDWQDDDVLRAVEWLKGFVPAVELAERLSAARSMLGVAQKSWAAGEYAATYDPRDTAAWYLLQGETFATDRRYWVPEDSVRIIPPLTRLGKELDRIRSIPGAEVRASRMMTADKARPDSGIFELLVALAYSRRNWSRVEFVPEQPGIRRTHDLNVFKRGSRWAVECKRLEPSTYARNERQRGRILALPAHALCLALDRSLFVDVVYHVELHTVPDEYLKQVVARTLDEASHGCWSDEISVGRVRNIDWTLARSILRRDDVYYGSSRMIEILAGHYHHNADYNMSAQWRPANGRPAYASDIFQASVVKWRNRSEAVLTRKAKHFRSVLANAENQLPCDRPGVVHIGLESHSDRDFDAARHLLNYIHSRSFALSQSRLRWVYANYFVPEVTTDCDETWAFTETMVPYKIGTHGTRSPLPGHMLVIPENEILPGVHWRST